MTNMKIKNLFATFAIAAVVFATACTKDDKTDDIVAPKVTSTSPVNNAEDVSLNEAITATFSEEMDALTINSSTFIVTKGDDEIEGVVTYEGTIATFTPNAKLLIATHYTATITTGAKNIAGVACASKTTWSFATGITVEVLANVELGSAGNYAILAKTAITNSPTSVITGDLGLSPAATSYITGFDLIDGTGFATSAQITGQVFAADMVAPTSTMLTTAVENMLTAYNDAAGRSFPDYVELGAGNIGGKTLAPGLYKWTTTVALPTDVTITGSETDIWIFQIEGDLSVSNDVKLTLTGGAKASNVFWQVAGAVSLGTSSHFEGVVMSMTSIVMKTKASFKGKAMAQTSVILDENTIN